MAVQRTPYRALLIGGALLFALYSLFWALLLRDPQLKAIRGEVEPGGDGEPAVYYRVLTDTGEVRVLAVDRNDPASVLVEAERRFGTVTSVKRVGRGAAEQLQSRQTATRLRRWFGVLLLLPLAVVVAGLWLRNRELRFERFWKTLSPTLNADAEKLGQAAELSDRALRTAVPEANSRGLAQLEWDAECNRILDTRLSLYNITIDFCERCNEPLAQRVLADLKHVPRCPTCLFEHDPAHLDEIKRPIVEQLLQESAAACKRNPDRKRFLPATFAMLLLLFPPAAIVYAVRHS
jgi:hypothetical protein